MTVKNKLYKSIAFAYPSSISAELLGFTKTGCWFVQHTLTNIEGSGQSKTFIAHNCEGFTAPDNPDLISLYHEYEGTPEPSFIRHGNEKALKAISR
jgi:hypothetical protein